MDQINDIQRQLKSEREENKQLRKRFQIFCFSIIYSLEYLF